jgi:hypothetical protein
MPSLGGYQEPAGTIDDAEQHAAVIAAPATVTDDDSRLRTRRRCEPFDEHGNTLYDNNGFGDNGFSN